MIAQPLLAIGPWERLAATPTAYLLVWGGLLVVGVGIVVLLRTRWAQSKPMWKCAVLSLLVHVMFACAAMTVKIVVGDGGELAGQGGPIRVRIIDGDGATFSNAMTVSQVPNLLDTPPTAPELVHLPESDASAVDPQKVPFETPGTPPTPSVASPPAQTVSAPVEVEKESIADAAVSKIEPPTSVTNNNTPIEPNNQPGATPAPTNLASESDTASAVPISPASNAAEAPGPVPAGPINPYAGRTSGDRLGLVESQGGNRQTEAAVVAALNWLAAAQSPDGRWDADRFGAGIERQTLGENRNGAGREADTGITSLAILAFLGAGHTHLAGDYQPTVQHGLEFLLRSQAADGSLFGGAGLYAQMYCHSMATFALAEAQAMSGDKRLAPGVSRAVGFSIRAQHPTTGGWRYEIGNKGDTSQLGWQTMAMASAERAGVEVPLQTWTGIERFLRSVRRGQFGGLASYQQFSPMSTSMTAEALYCRLMLIEKLGGEVHERASNEATRQILTLAPNMKQMNLYYWYYATLALHHQQTANEQAVTAWRQWNEALTTVLVESQIRDGANNGSWNPDMEWGGYGGRVYSTAMAAMCLEVYYRYVPAGATNPEVVVRPELNERAR